MWGYSFSYFVLEGLCWGRWLEEGEVECGDLVDVALGTVPFDEGPEAVPALYQDLGPTVAVVGDGVGQAVPESGLEESCFGVLVWAGIGVDSDADSDERGSLRTRVLDFGVVGEVAEHLDLRTVHIRFPPRVIGLGFGC